MLTKRGEEKARPPLQPIYDDFEPPKEWVQEPSNYILRLYLPQAFNEEDLNISYDQSGKITVRGTKQVGELRFARFQSSYNAPQDSNFEKICGILENNIFSLTIPRIIKRRPSEDKKEEPIMEKWVQEPSNYILRFYLPQAFNEEDLNTLYDQSGKITVRGIKLVDELNFARFYSSYNAPQDSNFEKIRGKLENNIVSLIIPRIIKHKPSEDEKEEPLMEEKAKMVAEVRKEEVEATSAKKKPSVAMEERKEDAVIKEKKEELVMKEKTKIITEARKEEDEATISKKKPIMADNERKEDAVIKEKKEEPVMEEEKKTVTEERKEEDEATVAKKKPLMAVEERKEEPLMEKKAKMVTEERKGEDELTVTKKKPSMAEEERKEGAVIEEKKEDSIMKEAMQHINEKMKEGAMKTTTAMEERIAEAEHLPELKEELQTPKERDAEERKDEAILNEMKKASIMKEKSRYCHEAEAGEKKPEVKERRKQRWIWNEEEYKGWLNWMDSGFIEEVLKKVYKNKKHIALALVAFTTGYFVSLKLRRRG